MYYPCSENKGADQLCGYRTTDLRLCFRICQNRFSYDAAHMPGAIARSVFYCSQKLLFMFKYACLPYVHPACRKDANGIKPGRNSKFTDKNAAEYSNTVCLVVNKYVCDA